MSRQKSLENLKKLTGVAMFAALAYVSVAVVRIPNIGGFLTMDFKDVIITICGMFFGPVAAVVIAIIVPLLELFTVSGTGIYGFIMNVISSVTFALVSSIIYKYKKTFWGAIIGLATAVASVTAIMMVANLIVTPYYTNMPTAAVAGMIPKLLLPFNFTKAMLNASLTLMLYKPLTSVMRKTGFFGKKTKQIDQTPEQKKKNIIRSVILFIISFIVFVVALSIILLVWNGEISFFDIFKPKS